MIGSMGVWTMQEKKNGVFLSYGSLFAAAFAVAALMAAFDLARRVHASPGGLEVAFELLGSAVTIFLIGGLGASAYTWFVDDKGAERWHKISFWLVFLFLVFMACGMLLTELVPGL